MTTPDAFLAEINARHQGDQSTAAEAEALAVRLGIPITVAEVIVTCVERIAVGFEAQMQVVQAVMDQKDWDVIRDTALGIGREAE